MEAHHFCPRCMSPEVQVAELMGIDGQYAASCPHCNWKGTGAETLGALTSETIWTADRVLQVLLNASIRTAAGPLVGTLEYVGLLPKVLDAPNDRITEDKLNKHNEIAQECRDRVLRSCLEALIVRALEEASEANRYYCRELDQPLHPLLSDDGHLPSTVRSS